METWAGTMVNTLFSLLFAVLLWCRYLIIAISIRVNQHQGGLIGFPSMNIPTQNTKGFHDFRRHLQAGLRNNRSCRWHTPTFATAVNAAVVIPSTTRSDPSSMPPITLRKSIRSCVSGVKPVLDTATPMPLLLPPLTSVRLIPRDVSAVEPVPISARKVPFNCLNSTGLSASPRKECSSEADCACAEPALTFVLRWASGVKGKIGPTGSWPLHLDVQNRGSVYGVQALYGEGRSIDPKQPDILDTYF